LHKLAFVVGPHAAGDLMVVRRLVAVAVGLAGVGIGATATTIVIGKTSNRPRTIAEAPDLADRKRWDGKPRGRVFIETPVNLTGRADLDSISASLTRLYQQLSARVATPIADDSVKAIERYVNTLPGVRGPRERLARANAQIGVMTMLNIEHDSLRVVVALQRIVDGTSSKYRIPIDPPRGARIRRPGNVVETWPIITAMESMAKPTRAVRLASSELARALQSMQSCDVEDHIDPNLPPWCWRKENEADIVPGYFERSHVVRTASR